MLVIEVVAYHHELLQDASAAAEKAEPLLAVEAGSGATIEDALLPPWRVQAESALASRRREGIVLNNMAAGRPLAPWPGEQLEEKHGPYEPPAQDVLPGQYPQICSIFPCRWIA